VSLALAALRAGAAALLDEEGQPELAALVRAARVELAGPGETWSMGAREVTAHAVALIVPAGALVHLGGDPAALGAVRAAFAQAMRSADTEMAALHVELLLPGVERPWGSVYRAAPSRPLPVEQPDPEAMLAGAAALLEAVGERFGAAMLGRARLTSAAVPEAGTPLTRVVVRLEAGDRAATWRDPQLEDQLRRAVRDAAVRAGEQVVVEIGVALPGAE
jgi:hypothetical protein